MSGLPWVPKRSMHFFRSRHAGIADLFSEAATPSSWLRSEERSKLSLRRACLPCGSDFPQTLLTRRRPVFPPDRAPLLSAPVSDAPVARVQCFTHASISRPNTSDER